LRRVGDGVEAFEEVLQASAASLRGGAAAAGFAAAWALRAAMATGAGVYENERQD